MMIGDVPGRLERDLRRALLGLALLPLCAQVSTAGYWRVVWPTRLGEMPVPTEMLLDGIPTLAAIAVLVASVFTFSRMHRPALRMLGESVVLLGLLWLGLFTIYAAFVPFISLRALT